MSVSRPNYAPHPICLAAAQCTRWLQRCLPNLACLLCGEPSRTPVCSYCESDSAFYDKDALPINLLLRPAVASHIRHAHYRYLYACGNYQWPFSTLVHTLKFKRKPVAATILADWFITHVLRHRDRPTPQCILPVPLHVRRLQQRLYNQSAEIAYPIGRNMAVPVIESWARRCGKGAQHTRNRHERLLAARDAFELSNTCLDNALEKGPDGQCVAIVDDVLTTGVTVDVLAAKLRQRYPWLTIEVWVMAVTPAPGQRRLSLEKV